MIDSRRRNTALLVAGCFFMENFDGTIVTTSAPRMAEAFGVEPAAVGLVSAAYLITLAVLIPLSNWLTRRYGTRPVFLSAIVIFTLASLGCALSQSLPMLVIMRILQGVGGAMMVPVGRMAVLNTAEKSDIVRLVAYIVWPALVAPVIAPLAGGLITTYLSWHWMFLINIPLGVLAFIAAWRLIDSIDAPAPPPLDWTGMVLSGVGLGGLTYAAHLITDPDPGPWPAIIGLASVIIIVIAVLHLLRAKHPLLNLRIWSVRTFRRVAGVGFRVHAGDVVGAVPAAVAVPAGVRLDGDRVRGPRALRLHRQHRDQAGDHRIDQRLRLPAAAGGRHDRAGRRRCSGSA